MNGQVWFITGASSGFGRAIAEQVLEGGGRVIATARKPESLYDLLAVAPDRVFTAGLDVTEPAQIRAAVEQGRNRFGRIDVLVNNAGRGLVGALEEYSDEQIRRNIETNFIGPLNVMRAVLPIVREQRAGHFVTISAVAAFSNEMGFAVYGGAKAAMEAATEAVASEGVLFGLKATIVEPGPFRTDFIGKSMEAAESSIDAYAGTSAKFAGILHKLNGKQPGDPVLAAKAIIAAVNSPKPPRRLILGKYAYDRVRRKLDTVAKEMAEWEAVGSQTDY